MHEWRTEAPLRVSQTRKRQIWQGDLCMPSQESRSHRRIPCLLHPKNDIQPTSNIIDIQRTSQNSTTSYQRFLKPNELQSEFSSRRRLYTQMVWRTRNETLILQTRNWKNSTTHCPPTNPFAYMQSFS